ncbi:VWA domain-containing protein [Candidatus Poribacteria bacterium]|nr:VWA domain-containing protein [Candidatus Poribacteria bacterium]MYB02445.1 VWA domain-containing protein [Candidatus Poribacteria bacterium]
MQEQQGSLEFLSSSSIMALGLFIVAVTGVLCWLAWHRSGYRMQTGWLELLRFVLVCLVVTTLNQPEWLKIQPPDRRSTLAVLWDQSKSMETRDVFDDQDLSGERKSRAETIQPLMSEAVWKPSDTTDLNVVFEPFSSQLDPAEEATDLNAGLSHVLDNHANLRGVVLLSDGDWNVGNSPVEAATRFRMKGIPVFAVGVGSKVPLPDLELVRMDAPTFGVTNKQLRIPFVVRSTLGQDRDVSVTLSVNNEAKVTKVVGVPAMSQAQDNIVWTPPATENYTLNLRIAQDAEELIPENNEISAPISIREEQLRVLVIESFPRWEYRYLRNALERDQGVEVTCLLFHPELPQVGGGRTYIKRFPDARELSRYDVVFLGDVGVKEDQLTTEQARELRKLVSAQASGIVFMPGRSGSHDTLIPGPLDDLYPVILDPATPQGVGSNIQGYFALTASGQRSLLTRLGDTDQDNGEVWRKLPGFFWYTGVKRTKAGTETLAVHDQVSTASGRVPLIVTKTYGTGKVLFMGTDSAWRWRHGVEDKYHYRFWSQVARWMAYRRQMAQSEAIRLFYSPDRPNVDDVLTLNANAIDNVGGPLDRGSVVVQAISPSGKTQTIRLQPGTEDLAGLFVGSFVPKEPGNYRLIASSSETGASVQTDLSVQGLNREQQGRLARFDVLDEIAKITEGKLVPVSEVPNLLEHLAALPEPAPTVHRTRLWAHPIWAGVLVFLLGAFWVTRKMNGAV